MGQLKPAMLQTATDPAAIQKAMLADLKGRTGKQNVKFVAAKNVPIGTKAVSLFIVTDTPAAFETVIKDKFPKAYRAKGTCDVLKVEKSSMLEVVIRTSAGQMTPDAVTNLVRPALGGGSSILASFGPSQTPPGLKAVPAPKDGGVPDWAKDEYIQESVRTVIASMTSDKKIGSLYFEGEGRIRTTHGSGPQRSEHGGQTTVQFNIDRKLAWKAFLKANPKTTKQTASSDYKKWIKDVLGKATASSVPPWAKLVAGPSTAMNVGSGAPTDDTQLIEIFKGINGRVEGWHPSRGAAVQFVTDKQAISVLHAAIKYIDGEGSPKIPKITGAAERNRAFYDFVKARLPKFAPLMREPSTVKTR